VASFGDSSLDIHTRPAFRGVVGHSAILLARWVSVVLPIAVISRWRKLPCGTVAIITWGGLRGGISVALALSLPRGHERGIVVCNLCHGYLFHSGPRPDPQARRAWSGETLIISLNGFPWGVFSNGMGCYDRGFPTVKIFHF
jgi:hypothetical protein